MKTLIVALFLALGAQAIPTARAADTMEKTVERARKKFLIKEAKKARKEAIKARYKNRIEALKDQQRDEMDNLEGLELRKVQPVTQAAPAKPQQ